MKPGVVSRLSIGLLLAGTGLIRTGLACAQDSSADHHLPSTESLPVTNRPGSLEAKARLERAYGRLPLIFEANQGQTDSSVTFLSRAGNHTLFLTKTAEAVLVLRARSPEQDRVSQSISKAPVRLTGTRTRKRPEAIRIGLVGVNPAPHVDGSGELPGKANYFIGKDPARWRTNVPTYRGAKYHDVYPGIDIVFYGNQRRLEQDFIVAPGANPRAIRLRVDGAKKVSVGPAGNLILALDSGEVRFARPVIYQESHGVRREVAGNYVRKGPHQVGFHVAAYDTTSPLIIDPVLSYSTYLGGGGQDRATNIAVDGNGNAYVTGDTDSADFPTAAAFQAGYGGGLDDAIVTKLDPAGSPVYSTYLGGSSGNGDIGFGIAVDAGGNAYVAGETGSSDFPTTPGAFQTTINAKAKDGFVTKLDPAGSALVYSTFTGGAGRGIALDDAGNAYVAGLDNVIKLNPTGSALVYSTTLASGQTIAVDPAGNAYVAGEVVFPGILQTTPGAFQTTYGGGESDAYVMKLNPAGSALVYSTYLGGSGFDSVFFQDTIAVDADGNAYVSGATESSDFPTTPGAFQTVVGGGFVTKLDPSGSSLVYSTLVGRSGDDRSYGIAVDACGNAYVTGFTDATDFPTTADALQPQSGGDRDGFVMKLNPLGTALVYSSYLGGSGYDEGIAIAVDPAGKNVYVAGNTASTDFPTTAGAYQSTYGGGLFDAFVTRIAFSDTTPPTISGASATPPSLWPPNHGLVTVTVNYGASDCPPGPVDCVLTVTSNEPVNGTGGGDTAPDWEVLDAHHVLLRSERSGTGSGRIYTITITCKDGSGNSSSQSVTVTVPLSQGGV